MLILDLLNHKNPLKVKEKRQSRILLSPEEKLFCRRQL